MFPVGGLSRTVAGALLVATAFGCAPPESTSPPNRAHALPKRDRVEAPFAPANAHLNYYGGHVISNVKVYFVVWGSSVPSATVSGMPGYFQAVTNSSYLDYLNEYDTTRTAQDGSQGTQQLIGRGTYAGAITLTPGTSGTQLTDAQISSELDSQITAGKLPPPDANTIYMTYFPPGISITQGGSQSCVAGGFCAYHGTYQRAGKSVFYGVMPDNGPGTGCDVGCGSGSAIDNLGMVSAHELTEAITDAEVGLASGSVGPPIAWYDSVNGEIGDICHDTTAKVGAYTVQQEWSNTAGGCIASRVDAQDFSVLFQSPAATIAAGSTVDVPLQTQVTAGAAQSLALAVSGLPSGVTGTLRPAGVTAGQGATLTLSATTAATPASDLSVVVTATGASPHSAALLLQVKPQPANDFSLSLTPAQLTFTPGSVGQLTVATTQLRGTPGPISLSVTGLPGTLTAQLAPASVPGGQSGQLTLSASLGAAPGTYPFVLSGQAGSASHQAAGTITVVAGPPAPFVQFSSPAPGAAVTGQTTVAVAASNVSANASLQVTLDGASLGTGQGATFSQSWDSTGVPNGAHLLQATVTDGAQSAMSQLPITVSNAVSVSVTSPAGGAALNGTVTVSAAASLAPGATLSQVNLFVDGLLVGSGTTSPLSVTVDTTKLKDGSHSVTAKASDVAGDAASSAPIAVTVHNIPLPGVSQGPVVTQSCAATGSGAAQWVLALVALGVLARRRSR